MHDTLLSVILVVQEAEATLAGTLARLSALLAGLVSDYEIIVVDNGSADRTVEVLQQAVGEHPNIQVYCLPTAGDRDVALIAGLENAIGDYVVLLDPALDDPAILPAMLAAAMEGHDIVLARARGPVAERGALRRLLSGAYIRLFRCLSGLDLRQDAPRYRLMSRRVVNYVLQHEASFLVYQVVPVAAGFRKTVLEHEPLPASAGGRAGSLRAEVSRALAMLVSTSSAPMRLVSGLCLTAALLSLLYSVYVVANYLFNAQLAPGWTTLSLQLSGMFFLLSIALAVLSEYVIRILHSALRHPPYYIAREFRSASLTRELKLNVRHREEERPASLGAGRGTV